MTAEEFDRRLQNVVYWFGAFAGALIGAIAVHFGLSHWSVVFGIWAAFTFQLGRLLRDIWREKKAVQPPTTEARG